MFDRIERIPPNPDADKAKELVSHMTLTVEEMAEELNISRATAYKLVKDNGFPAFNIGQRLLVNRKGLQKWIDERCRIEPMTEERISS